MTTKLATDPTKIYVAIDSFAGDDISVKRGMRLRGDNPIVLRCRNQFAEDGTPDEELTRLRVEQTMQAEASIPKQNIDVRPTVTLRRVAVVDQMLCIRSCGVLGTDQAAVSDEPLGARPGNVISRRTKLYRDNRDCFVSITNGVPRENALVATETLTMNGEIVVRAGQWLDKNHPIVAIQWQHFTLPELEREA